jgi:UDP-N-acetylglucosamine 1-carboxyvinyltransferase
MSSFVIEGLAGKKSLKGTIAIPGMKNAVLPIMAAATLINGESNLTNVPDIADVKSMVTLIEELGGFVSREDHKMSIRTQDFSGTVLNAEIAKRMRASVLMTGPILARLGQVTFPHPGGCVLGSRPIDIFVTGFQKMGATYTETGESYTLSAPNGLQGTDIFFRVVSVTGTESFLIAAALAKGVTVLRNCAMEPEVVATAEFLNSCGAKIEGAGTPTITITPSALHAPEKETRIIPDRIEAGSFMVLAALAGSEVTITGADPEHLGAIIEALTEMGVHLEVSKEKIVVRSPELLKPMDIRTHEYPGFATDLQAPMGVLLTQAAGESSILETIFDGRLNYTSELVRMGANIQLGNPHKAVIKGPALLKARDIDGPDIRAGLAFILAGIIAEGQTKVGNAHLVDRGYEKIEERLRALGVSITRVD